MIASFQRRPADLYTESLVKAGWAAVVRKALRRSSSRERLCRDARNTRARPQTAKRAACCRRTSDPDLQLLIPVMNILQR